MNICSIRPPRILDFSSKECDNLIMYIIANTLNITPMVMNLSETAKAKKTIGHSRDFIPILKQESPPLFLSISMLCRIAVSKEELIRLGFVLASSG